MDVDKQKTFNASFYHFSRWPSALFTVTHTYLSTINEHCNMNFLGSSARSLPAYSPETKEAAERGTIDATLNILVRFEIEWSEMYRGSSVRLVDAILPKQGKNGIRNGSMEGVEELLAEAREREKHCKTRARALIPTWGYVRRENGSMVGYRYTLRCLESPTTRTR
ncbi:PREDICTED: uncharacterized protein LOC108548604 [Eufriesea mexicana]|uniref:uncharacterized protein LOC108548604 n=1 Tax=Eufriesea mexicana TaxID=516756 RepID=UPI00083BB0ED|nr:PREDICTED: uncharacterized protein LOC108548604 [Eufriesea mexicana]